MSTISRAQQTPAPVQAPKAQETKPAGKETTLDKMVDWTKDKTKEGTLVGDHYVLVGAGTLVGAVAAGSIKPVREAVSAVFSSKLTGAAAGLGTAYILGEDAIESFKEGSFIKGGAETLGATAAGLGGVEFLGRQFNIPVANKAFTGTAEAIGNNWKALSGAATFAGGGAAIVSGVNDIKENAGANTETALGAGKIVGGSVAVLGGAELIGRQFNIPVVNKALTGLVKSKGGLMASSGVAAASGAGLAVDGVRRLATENGGFVNDLIGAAEVAAGVTAGTGAVSLYGLATKNAELAKMLPENAAILGGTAMVAGATALAKHSANDMVENGVGVWNSTKGTGAALLGLGGVAIAGEKLGVGAMENAFSKGWQPAVALGLGGVTYKLGKDAIADAQEGKGAALAKGGAAVITGASSLVLAGSALGIKPAERLGEAMLEGAGKVLEPVFEVATKHPVATLVALGVATGAGIYIYNQSQDKSAEAEAAKQAKPATEE